MKRESISIYTDKQHDDPLQKQFKALQIQWDSIKQSFSRSNRRNSVTTSDHRLFELCHNSPKELMSLLQVQKESVASRNHDRAVVEVIEQREADFDNGRLKGRRLFEDSDDEYVGCFDVDEKSEVSTEFSCMGFENYDESVDWFSGCCGSSVAVVAVMGGGRGGGGGRYLVGRFLICVVVMLALAIVAFKCSCEDQQVLVPT